MKNLQPIIREHGIEYILYGDCYIPQISLTEHAAAIGHYGRMRRDYLKEHRPALWNRLILSEQLWQHLAEVDRQANSRMQLLMEQMFHAEGITEALKASDPMGWTGRMNSIHSRAEEIVLNELIFEA